MKQFPYQSFGTLLKRSFWYEISLDNCNRKREQLKTFNTELTDKYGQISYCSGTSLC